MLRSTIRSLMRALLRPAWRQSAGRSASAIRAARTFGRTSWTRTMSTPAATPEGRRRERRLEALVGAAGRGPCRGSTCARCRGGSAGRGRAALASSRSRPRLWAGVLPNPNPGSTTIDPTRRRPRAPARSRAGGPRRSRPSGSCSAASARLCISDDRHAAGRGERGSVVVGADAPDVVDEVGARHRARPPRPRPSSCRR